MTPEQEFNYSVIYCFTHRVLFDDDDAHSFLAHANCERCDIDVLPMNPAELEALHAQVRRQLKSAATPAEKRSALVLANEAQFQQEVADVFKSEKAPAKMPTRRPNALLLGKEDFEGAYQAAQVH